MSLKQKLELPKHNPHYLKIIINTTILILCLHVLYISFAIHIAIYMLQQPC